MSGSRLHLGTEAPNFTAQTQLGEIDLHDYLGDSWGILFAHPDDFTPVCTTELGAFAKLEPEFARRNVKLVGLSANDVNAHISWIKDIYEVTGYKISFPIIADPDRTVGLLYDMVDQFDERNVDPDGNPLTMRSVYIIAPNKKIRLVMQYPASTGRNTAEILRVIDSLQASDKLPIATPINWAPGDDVIILPSVSDEEARRRFPSFRSIKPYLRFTPI